jgi:GAF domain-containing protein
VTVASTLARLLAESGASRVTLRCDLPGDRFFPVTDEALAPGVPSIRGNDSVDLRSQPVVHELRETGRQVVQDDCRALEAGPEFERMLDAFGGLGAQIVTPVVADGRLAAILSLHQLGGPREWTEREAGLASEAARELAALLDGGGRS